MATLALGMTASGCMTRTEPAAETPIRSDSPATAGTELARAPIESRSGSQLEGEAEFTQQGEWVEMVLTVRNAPPGLLAVHLHEIGDCSAADAGSAGPHWNPTDERHGQLGVTGEAHLGDIGNLEVGQDGTGEIRFRTRAWSIGREADRDIVGRSVVVHAEADDFVSQPSGDAGDRIGCGVIAQVPHSRL
jgi:superoxide dismutase, Cu-Zn family